MDKTLKNIKIWSDTLHKAKLLAVLCRMTMVQVIDELVSAKLEEVQSGQKENSNN